MYIKINSKAQFAKILAFFLKNGYKVNDPLKGDFVPEFIFVIKDEKPLIMTPYSKMLIWDGTKESVGSNYWDAEKDFDKIEAFGTDPLIKA